MSDSHKGNGEQKRPAVMFPTGYRRRVAGETTAEGDLYRDCMTNDEWRPADPGNKVRTGNQLTFACPARTPVDLAVVEKMMARFQLFVIENLYLVENIATASAGARNCRCCGATGDYDVGAFWAMMDGLHADHHLTDAEYDEVCEADDEDAPLEAYEDILARHDEDESDLPRIPLRYDHEPDCTAMMLYRMFGAFADVFGGYVTAKYDNLHTIADLGDDESFI